MILAPKACRRPTGSSWPRSMISTWSISDWPRAARAAISSDMPALMSGEGR